MELKMNKEIFLRDLRRFLADIPEDEREQALKYYEDYFEDAGSENEQQVIQELGSPLDVAKQIKSTNQESISYGQGNDFIKNKEYPNPYENAQNNYQNTANGFTQNNYSQNAGYTQGTNSRNNPPNHGAYAGAYQEPKKSWTQDSSKIVLVIILAILAIPVGIPLVSTIFGLVIAAVAVIFAFMLTVFIMGGALVISGVVILFGCFFSAGGVANILLLLGISLVLISIGLLIIWFSIFLCAKFFPALGKGIGKLVQSIVTGVQSFFH